MANNFSTLIDNRSVRKFNLVRIEPARYISSWTDLGGNLYSTTLTNMDVSKVEFNTVVGTEVTTTPSSPREYLYNSTTGVLTIYDSTAPSSAYPIVVYHYLFYSNDVNRAAFRTPNDSTTELRDWQPKILSSPSVQQNLKNLTAGTFSLGSISISINDADGEIKQFLSSVDSFYNKKVEVWSFVDNEENISKTYSGLCTKLSVTNKEVNITVVDPFAKLNNVANFDNKQSANDQYGYFDNGNALKGTIDPRHENKPVPIFFGRFGMHDVQVDTTLTGKTSYKLLPDTMQEIYCSDYTTTISTSTNRDWIGYRTAYASNSINARTFTPTTVDHTGLDYTLLAAPSSVVQHTMVGQTVYDTPNPGSAYGIVIDVDYTNNYIYTTKQASWTTSTELIVQTTSVVISDNQGNAYYPYAGRDYSITVDVVEFGNESTTFRNAFHQITFNNNFEATLSMATLDPRIHKVELAVTPARVLSHGEVLLHLLRDVLSLDCNETSFTTADTTLDVDCAFRIPFKTEGDFGSYLRYIEEILKSTGGYLYLDNNFEINYGLLTAPSSTDARTEDDILRDSLKIDVEYRDIATQLIGYNPHYTAEYLTSGAATPNVTVSDTAASALHGIQNTDRFRHVLEDMSSRLQDILDIRKNRQATYSFKTAHKDLDTFIGDDLQLESSTLLGADTARDIKVIGVNKNKNDVTIIGNDLIDL